MGIERDKKVRGRRDILKTVTEENVEEKEERNVNEVEKRCMNSKMQMLTHHQDEGVSLYNHLSMLITEVLDGTPICQADDIENLSRRLKRERVFVEQSTIRTCTDACTNGRQVKAEWRHFHNNYEKPTEDEDYDTSEADDRWTAMPNILRQNHVFQTAGVGLPSEEYVRLAIAMKELVRLWSVESIRFWGKIFGRFSDYYIVEAQFPDGDYDSDIDESEICESGSTRSDFDKLDSEFDDFSTLKPDYNPPPKVPSEPAGVGLNKKVYFVCNELCQPWVRLPHVTPTQITAAKKIRKFFTGNLENELESFPPFPGLEKNYLRAQIARISCSTQISPIGYFKFDEDVEDEEDEEDKELDKSDGRESFVEDSDFQGLVLKEMISVNNWVHHTPYILPQGRTTWYNVTSSAREETDEAEEEEEEKKEPDEPEPETGPPLLTPISEDKTKNDQEPAWITRKSSLFIPEFSVAVMLSNIWPGAVAVATDKGRFFENVYVGWGLKNLEDNFEPALPKLPTSEFPTGPEVIEADDPTPETEAAVLAALQKKETEELAVAEEEEEEQEDAEDAEDEAVEDEETED